jgi:hypothetical protein
VDPRAGVDDVEKAVFIFTAVKTSDPISYFSLTWQREISGNTFFSRAPALDFLC